MQNDNPQTTLVLGGGPAGLTAGYLLGKTGREVVVFEAEDQVGGLAKTVEIDGYRFDLGGHRFFTKVKEVDDLWHEIMREEFLERLLATVPPGGRFVVISPVFRDYRAWRAKWTKLPGRSERRARGGTA